MHGGVKMREPLYCHRAHPVLKKRKPSAERVIKSCILAFPSIWVGCNTVIWIGLAEKRLPPSFLSVIMFLLDILCILILCSYSSITHFLLTPWFFTPSMLSRMWVALAHLQSFIVLTCLTLYTLQVVSAPHSFFSLSSFISLCTSVCECTLLAHFSTLSSLVPCSLECKCP